MSAPTAHTYYVVTDGMGAIVGATIHPAPTAATADSVERRVTDAGLVGPPFRFTDFRCVCRRAGCCPPIEWALDDETARAIDEDESLTA